MKITIPVTVDIDDDHVSGDGYILNKNLEPIQDAATGEPLTPVQWLREYRNAVLDVKAYLKLPERDHEWITVAIGTAEIQA